jgi:predicted dehydrogenase
VAHYDKGLHNNGSHLLDLISQFLGLPVRITPLSGGREPGPHGDPTLDLLLHLPGAGGEFPAYLIGSDHRAFSLFELDILGTGGRLTLADKGQQIHLQVAADDPNWPGYRKLAPALVQPGGMSECWTRLTGELVGCEVVAEVRRVDVDGVAAGRLDDPHAGTEQPFAEVLHAGRVQAPACGGPQALAVMTLLEAARLAWQRGAPVSVEEVLS